MSIATELERHYAKDEDFMLRRAYFGGAPVALAGFKTMIDFPQSLTMLRQQLHDGGSSEGELLRMLAGIGRKLENGRLDELTAELRNARLLVVHEPSETVFSLFPITQPLHRSVSEPLTENPILNPSGAFNEDMDLNLGMLRMRINSDNFHFSTHSFGRTYKSRVTLAYLEGEIHPTLLRKLTDRLTSRTAQASLDIGNLQDLIKLLGLSKSGFVTRFRTCETPANAVRALRNGRAVIFIECLPYAIVVPSLASDFIMSEEDRNYPFAIAMVLRCYRVFGLLLMILLPALYVSLVSVNPDVLRFELAHSIAKSRLEVPYPAFVETLVMMVILELLMEALIRLPASIGPAITMVGGIVLGQAAVAAKLVSNLLIIVLAAGTISGATAVGFQNVLTFRMFKYVTLVLSALYGVLGTMAGLVLVCAYLACEKTLDIPYLQLNKPEGE
ncbi:GerA spore germination protein [Paenibacillus sp. UNC496MF]|uniref:spore germination protein n=1 Tax=Paenibacillus sp. UNC496MF TaxID=1502753 RepID=UPI0008E120FE|nr:spore germination protein [Paenibacillus sp. UNC496MF]SFI38757.1 GerA spore germination protein [Paenibacillus sp. UNC496MF]